MVSAHRRGQASSSRSVDTLISVGGEGHVDGPTACSTAAAVFDISTLPNLFENVSGSAQQITSDNEFVFQDDRDRR